MEKAAETEALNGELQRLRADNAGKENTIRQLQEELEMIEIGRASCRERV